MGLNPLSIINKPIGQKKIKKTEKVILEHKKTLYESKIYVR